MPVCRLSLSRVTGLVHKNSYLHINYIINCEPKTVYDKPIYELGLS